MSSHTTSPSLRVLSPTRRKEPPSSMTVLQPDKETGTTASSNPVRSPVGKNRGKDKAQVVDKKEDLIVLSSDKKEEVRLLSAKRKKDLRTVEDAISHMSFTEGKLDSSSMNGYGDDREQPDEVPPIDLLTKFLTTLMEKNYLEAKQLCQEILTFDPENPLCQDFLSSIDDMIGENDVEDSDDSSQSSGASDETSDENEEDEESSEDESTSSEEGEESENDTEDKSVLRLNLLMGGVPVKKNL